MTNQRQCWFLSRSLSSPKSLMLVLAPEGCQEGPFPSLLHPVSARAGPTRPSTCGGAKESAGEHA
eukprot:scaffold8862_cov30-Phaeocystis_antarctica.AAC.1